MNLLRPIHCDVMRSDIGSFRVAPNENDLGGLIFWITNEDGTKSDPYVLTQHTQAEVDQLIEDFCAALKKEDGRVKIKKVGSYRYEVTRDLFALLEL